MKKIHSGGVYHFENDDIGHRFKQNRNQFLFFQKGELVPLFESERIINHLSFLSL